jgi:hypothetical protein
LDCGRAFMYSSQAMWVSDLSVSWFAKHSLLVVLMLASRRIRVCAIRQRVNHRWATIIPVLPGMAVDLKEKTITNGLVERSANDDQFIDRETPTDSHIWVELQD